MKTFKSKNYCLTPAPPTWKSFITHQMHLV